MDRTVLGTFLSSFCFPFDALPELGSQIINMIRSGELLEYGYEEKNGVLFHHTASIDPSASVISPAIIGPHAKIGPHAYVRENTVIGDSALIGHCSEVKNCVISDSAVLPHFSYAGDSIIGYKAHFGAGAIASNVRIDGNSVPVSYDGRRIDTGLHKAGAFIADEAEIGCSSVLNPGTIIGKGSRVYPMSSVSGTVPPYSIYKSDGTIVEMRLHHGYQ